MEMAKDQRSREQKAGLSMANLFISTIASLLRFKKKKENPKFPF